MDDKKMSEIIATNLTALLESRGKTQADLARDINVTTCSVSNWCNGIKTPRMDKIDRICAYLKCNRSDIMTDPSDRLKPLEKGLIEVEVFKELNSENYSRLLDYANFLLTKQSSNNTKED